MIAAVKGWSAAFPALLFILPLAAAAAEDLNGAARELARRTAAYSGRGDAVSIVCRNLSSLTPAALEQARGAFEAALQEAGVRIAESGSSVEARLTLSEDQSQFLLIEEARKGDDRQVWIASWKRGVATARALGRIRLDRTRVWDQDEQILDAILGEAGLLVLSPSSLRIYVKDANGQWQAGQAAPIPRPRPWPRDLRGHVRLTGQSFQVFLPGLTCLGTIDAVAAMACRVADEPWLLESGSRGILLASFAVGRNYFDGRVVTQSGARRTVAPFYSAAAVDDQGRTFWLLALVDGRVQVVDGSFEPLGTIPGWGSDIAGLDENCGAGSQILATKPTGSGEPDAVQLFAVANRTAAPIAVPVTFSGPVTALWTTGGSSATAVERDPTTGRYSVYVLKVACGD